MKLDSLRLWTATLLAIFVVSQGNASAWASIIGVTDTGQIDSYESLADFVAGTSTPLGTVTAYGNDAGGFVDPDSGSIIWVTDSGAITSYPTLTDFVNDANSTVLGTPSAGAAGDDAGGYIDPATGDIVWLGNTGFIVTYESLANFVGYTTWDEFPGTIAAAGNDAGGFVDPDSGDIVWVGNTGFIVTYESLANFVVFSPFDGFPGTRAELGNDPGFFVYNSLSVPESSSMLMIIIGGIAGMALVCRRHSWR